MSSRSYGQMCSVARALDILGERWTLLVVRELLLGPKRFKDLLAALPAMGSNRLSDRLGKLQDAGVVERRLLPPPAGVQVYELTDSGERLRAAIYALGAWGRELAVPADVDRRSVRAELIALGLAGTSAPELSAGMDALYEFEIGVECFHMSVRDGSVSVGSGPAPGGADLCVRCELATFLALAPGERTPADALRGGAIAIDGERGLLERAFRILRLGDSATALRLVPA